MQQIVWCNERETVQSSLFCPDQQMHENFKFATRHIHNLGRLLRSRSAVSQLAQDINLTRKKVWSHTDDLDGSASIFDASHKFI